MLSIKKCKSISSYASNIFAMHKMLWETLCYKYAEHLKSAYPFPFMQAIFKDNPWYLLHAATSKHPTTTNTGAETGINFRWGAFQFFGTSVLQKLLKLLSIIMQPLYPPLNKQRRNQGCSGVALSQLF